MRLITLVVAVTLGAFIGLMAWADHADRVAAREWREFAAAHHCSIKTRTWGQNTWACDGFEVEHQ